MLALSLKERLEWLERELLAGTFRIYDDLPFALLVYEPSDEWLLRAQLKLLAARLARNGRAAVEISLAELAWAAIGDPNLGGLDTLVQLERERGFEVAQAQVNTYLTDRDFHPLSLRVAERMSRLDRARDIAFLVRAASLAPDAYQLSTLLESMQGRTNGVPGVLFYPGELVDTNGLRFMKLPDRDALGSYRVKIYA